MSKQEQPNVCDTPGCWCNDIPDNTLETLVEEGLNGMWNAHVDFSTSPDFKPRTEAKSIRVKKSWLDMYKATIVQAHKEAVEAAVLAVIGEDEALPGVHSQLQAEMYLPRFTRNSLRAEQRKRLKEVSSPTNERTE